MADSAYAPRLAARITVAESASRHSAVVRITHWVAALSFVGLVVGNQAPEAYSAGANLFVVVMAAGQKNWSAIEQGARELHGPDQIRVGKERIRARRGVLLGTQREFWDYETPQMRLRRNGG